MQNYLIFIQFKCLYRSILDFNFTVNSAEEIVSKLQTVWRVLRELLSHQSECPKTQDVPEVEQNDGMVPKNRGSACYKSIQTPTGPRLVLSVSKTYIRLKVIY